MEGNARTSHESERQHARQSSPGAGLPAAYPRKSSPNAAPPAAFPRKSSPNAPENSVFRPFWARRANFFALAATQGRAGRTVSRTARDDGATLRPATPLQATLRVPLKPTTPLQGRNGAKWPFSARKGDGGFIPLQGSASKGAVGFIARYEHASYGTTGHTHNTR